MPRPLDVAYLQPGEEPILVAHRHRLSAVDGALGILVAVGVALAGLFILTRMAPDAAMPFLGGLLAVIVVAAVIGLVALWWRVQTSRYVVTPERVYRSHGRIRFRLLQTTYDKVTDLHVRQSLFGRWWGFGDVTLHTAGTGLRMSGVSDPFAMKQRLEEARTRFLATLIEEHRVEIAKSGARREAVRDETGTATAPVPRHARETLWRGGPTPAAMVPAVVPAIIMFVAALVMVAVSLAAQTAMLLIIAAFLAVSSVATIAGAIIQYRFTRYEVADWGVVVTSGWLTRKRVETTYSKVTDVASYQGILGRVFNFGNITINTAGSNQAPVVFHGLAAPDSVKGIIDRAREDSDRGRRRA